MSFKNFIVVATLHKAGTVLLRNIFSEFSEENDFKFTQINNETIYTDLSNSTFGNINFDDHSNYLHHYRDITNSKFKFLQCIRDPRDLLVSATKYHLSSKEEWLYKKEKHFNGFSYNEMINKFETFEEKCFFEINNASYQTMENLDICSKILLKTQKNIKFVKLENLMQDYDLLEYKSIFDFLDIDEKYLNSFIKFCIRYSIWNIKEKNILLNAHIQHKKPGFWKEELPESIIDFINNKWPNMIQNLGYN